jgi:hypothetical protein
VDFLFLKLSRSRLLLADQPGLGVYDHDNVYCFGIASGLSWGVTSLLLSLPAERNNIFFSPMLFISSGVWVGKEELGPDVSAFRPCDPIKVTCWGITDR